VAIVPLGLTRYNTDPRLTAVTPDFCREIIREIAPVQKDLRRRLGTNFAYLGDEIYLRAGRSVPGRSHYGDYPQIEDGIGMVRAFDAQFASLLRKTEQVSKRPGEPLLGTIMTGTLFAPVLRALIEKLNLKTGSCLHVEAVENGYFGGDVSVAGLVTGGDLVSARAEIRGEFVIIPRQMLKSDGDIFLDGLTLQDVEREIGLPVHALDIGAFSDFVLRRN
jgi:NifB/MoaA-like Fe-S oxidoreductase